MRKRLKQAKPWLFTTALAIFTYVIVYHLFLSDQYQNYERALRKEQTLRADFEKKQHMTTNLSAYKEQQKSIEKNLSELIRQLPIKLETHEIHHELFSILKKAGISSADFKQIHKTKQEFFSKYTVEIRFISDYKTLLTLLQELTNQEQISDVERVDISTKSQLLSVRMHIVYYTSEAAQL
ncbi:Tfp pilus assembly protein PilO [Alteromonadaceae bacterium 2753L.S.0a.02]|nr:Tfp pilus assembly protein PilO [Alteromonadaceae bacterium 2753L.S.0a.02]